MSISVMWICDPAAGPCICDDEQYSCSCDVVRGARPFCAECREPMILINADDGSPVTVQPSERAVSP